MQLRILCLNNWAAAATAAVNDEDDDGDNDDAVWDDGVDRMVELLTLLKCTQLLLVLYLSLFCRVGN